MRNPKNKLSYEEVYKYIEQFNCTLLDKEYIDSKTKMNIACSCDNKFLSSFSQFKKSSKKCKDCANKAKSLAKIKFSFEFIKNYFENEGCILLESEYVDMHTLMNYICKCGKKSHITFNKFKNAKQRCKDCGIKKRSESQKIPYEDVCKIFSDSGCILLDSEYINNRTNMNYLCVCGTPSQITLDSFKSGQRCKQCGIEKSMLTQRHSYEFVVNYFKVNDCELLDDEYINCHAPMNYKCVCGNKSIIAFSNFEKGVRCKECAQGRISGEGHWNWKGGISPLSVYLREKIEPWKKDSMKSSNFKCVITNERFDIIHHLYSFNEIMIETIEELGYPIYTVVNNYTQEELDNILNKCMEIHYKYPLGVCLTNEIHELFHSLYGYGKNTPEQFDEFKLRYSRGEFNNNLQHEPTNTQVHPLAVGLF